MAGAMKEGGICPNCFDTKYSNGECVTCGYRDIYNQKNSLALQPGTMLNERYILGKVLGAGGFGITYKACDVKGGQLCAIKEYSPAGICCRMDDGQTMGITARSGIETYERGLRRFFDEAQILRRLGDIPAVVRISDCFNENHTAYFVMEFLEGANLNQIVRMSRHQVPFEEITNIIAAVGQAMDKIHREAHILHRDISPENIYVTREQNVKLIDFGSAKENALHEDQEYSVILKLKFAPPEQYSSNMRQGPYTDVYALAGTYYYSLTGLNLPTVMDRFNGETYVPLKQMNIGVPEHVSDTVDRALELNYQKRIQTMAEFVMGITGSQPDKPLPRQRASVTYITKILPYLEVVSGHMMGARWNLPSNMELKIGRSQKMNHIVITGHADISKIHCLVYYDEQKEIFFVKDVSTNGTYINGKRLGAKQVYSIKPGSNIALASASCVIRLGVSMVKTNA